MTHEERRQERNTRNQLKKKITQAEGRCHSIEEQIAEIDKLMAQEGFYEGSQEDVRAATSKRKELELELDRAFEKWERLSTELGE